MNRLSAPPLLPSFVFVVLWLLVKVPSIDRNGVVMGLVVPDTTGTTRRARKMQSGGWLLDPQRQHSQPLAMKQRQQQQDDDKDQQDSNALAALSGTVVSRRSVLQSNVCFPILAAAAAGCISLFVPPPLAHADTTPSSSTPLLSELLTSLRAVPTFCIVNSQGAAYMLFQADRGGFARGYAFFTFSGALTVLADAQKTADKGGYGDVWKDATITTIPADIAMRLTLQPRKRTSQKDAKKGLESTVNTEIALIPGIEERQAAIPLDAKFKEQASVPLFYLDNPSKDDSTVRLYLNPNDLLKDWDSQNPGVVPPRIEVVDLVTLFQFVVRKRATEVAVLKNPLAKVVFVPDSQSVQVAAELKQKGLAPYDPNRMII